MAFHVDPQYDIYRFLYDTPFASHMIVDGIQEYDGVYRLQGMLLPFFYDRQDLVCDAADRAVRDIDIIQFLHV